MTIFEKNKYKISTNYTNFFKNYTNFEADIGHTNSHKEVIMFNLQSKFKPTGDQPKAINYLTKGIEEGKKFQTLLGVTGSRKNFYNGKYYTKCSKANTNFGT